MARVAGAQRGRMLELGLWHRLPNNRGVARVAGIVGGHMRRGFANRWCVVVAGKAGASGHTRVVKSRCRNKACGRMAKFAGVDGRQMGATRTLQLANNGACCNRDRAAVAGEAGAQHLRVIGLPRCEAWRELRCVVAIDAGVGGRQMLVALADNWAGGD